MRAGDHIARRYRLLEPLCAGGMGTVWRARHTELEVEIALKFPAKGREDGATLRRFRLEAQAAARLQSPHIVRILDYGVHCGQPYLAMELLRGESLAKRLSRVGPLEPLVCLPILDGIASALALAHSQGIVHRDLKPENVFLAQSCGQEVVKVLDFGIAKDVQITPTVPATGEGELVGSPPYMSPEQVLEDPVGPASDVWAVGVVALEMLTGNNPFAAESLARTFERILREPLDIKALCAGLPAQVADCFQQVFERTPDARIQTVPALVERLRHALMPAPRRGSAGRFRWPPWRHIVLVAGVASGVFLLVDGALTVPATKTGKPAEVAMEPVSKKQPLPLGAGATVAATVKETAPGAPPVVDAGAVLQTASKTAHVRPDQPHRTRPPQVSPRGPGPRPSERLHAPMHTRNAAPTGPRPAAPPRHEPPLDPIFGIPIPP